MEEKTDYITIGEVDEAMDAGKRFPDSPSGVDPRRICNVLKAMAKDKMPLVLEELGDNERWGIYADMLLPNGDFIGMCDPSGRQIGVVHIDVRTKSVKTEGLFCTGYEAYEKVKSIVGEVLAA